MFKQFILVAVLVLSSCAAPVSNQSESGSPEPTSNGGQQERTLVLWTHDFPPFNAAFQEKWIPEFEAAHPGVIVQYEVFPYSGAIVNFDARLLADVFSGGGPDVWAMASHNFIQVEYLEAGMLAPLDPKVFGYDSLDDLLGDYPENSLSVFVRDGQIYGLLNELTTLCLYYNKDLFDTAGVDYLSEEVPTSWEQIGEISGVFLEQDQTSDVPSQMAYQFGFFANYPAPEWYVQNFYPIMRQYGQDDLYVGGKPAGDSAAVVDALQVFYDFTHVYNAYDPHFASDWFSDFANNRVAMVTAGPWFTSAIRDLNPEVRFGVAPHPVVNPDEPDTYSNVMYSFGWVVNANSDPEQQELAQEFLAFILGKKGEAEQPLWWLEHVGILQPRTAFLESSGFEQRLEEDPWLECFIETFDTYRVDYYQHSSDESGAALVRAINRVVYDQMSPEESARLLQQELLLMP